MSSPGARQGPLAHAFTALALGVFGVGVPASAYAADLKLQAMGNASVGYSDNVRSAPTNPLPGQASRAPGAMLLASPGLVLALASRSNVQRLNYTYTFDLVLSENTGSTSSNQLEYRAFFDLSPRVGLVLGANAVQTNRYSAVVLVPPGMGAVNAMPAGSGSFLASTLDEMVTYELARAWRTYESGSITYQTPLFDTVAPRTFLTRGRVGLETNSETDAFGIEGRLDYAAVHGSVRPDGTPLGEQRQMIGTGVGTWRHDWGRYFTSRLELGALRAQRLNTEQGFWEPAATAALAFITEVATAEATYAHLVTINPLLGQSFLVDEAQLRGAIPLADKDAVVVAASSGYQHGRLLDQNSTLAASVDSILFDVGVGWQATEHLILGVRYQFIDQISDAQVPPLPLTFYRSTVLIGAMFRYPPEAQMPRAYRAPRRVDQRDEIRDTVRPIQAPSRPAGNGT